MTRSPKLIFRPAATPAFSLVELLVVISIMALLMGLIVPALSRARSIAEQTSCNNRLRQWGLAFQLYAEQNDGFYPHIDGRDRTESDPESYEQLADYYFGWIDVLPPLVGERPWRDYDYAHKPGIDTIARGQP